MTARLHKLFAISVMAWCIGKMLGVNVRMAGVFAWLTFWAGAREIWGIDNRSPAARGSGIGD